MDLDSRGISKLVSEYNTHGCSEDYIRIVDALCLLGENYDHETPEMWCSRDLFRQKRINWHRYHMISILVQFSIKLMSRLKHLQQKYYAQCSKFRASLYFTCQARNISPTSYQSSGVRKSKPASECEGKSHDFLFLNILILHYASMQSEINDPVICLSKHSPSEIDSLKQRITELEAENYNIIKAGNIELKARIAKLEDKQTQNELIKNLLSILQKT